MRFYKKGKLKDKEIEAALRKAADDYADGAIWEVRNLLLDIAYAIDDFVDDQEE